LRQRVNYLKKEDVMKIANSIRAKYGLFYLIWVVSLASVLFPISTNAQPTATSRIVVTPGSLNFGPLKTGVPSIPKAVTVKNTGKADLVISSFSISGDDASEFNQTNNCNGPVPAGGACTLSVTLIPATPFGNKKATLNVDSNDPIRPTVHANLMGKAAPPVISAIPMSVNLGSVSTTQTSQEKTVTINNTGKSDLTITSMTITGPNASEFSTNSACPAVLTSGDKCTVTVDFSPITIGPKSASLDVISNDPKKSELTVRLSGKAVAYSLTDLKGTWDMSSLASGPGAPWWERGTLTINTDGTFTGSAVQSNGSPDDLSGTFTTSTSGLIKVKGNSVAKFRMDSGKTVMAGTSTWKGDQAGTTDFFVLTRKADSYSLADLEGTWDGNSLASGPGAPCWERANLVIYADGTFSASTVESTGATGNVNGTWQISSDGIITLEGDTTVGCSMDSHKTIIVCTDTWSKGQPGTTEMKIFTKKADSYSLADLEGTWQGNALASGPGAPRWDRSTWIIDADGTVSASDIDSTGDTDKKNDTWQISSDGIITSGQSGTTGCCMDLRKRIIVCTVTWSHYQAGTTEIHILMKEPN
jgi:hypothetical protein